MRGFESRPSLSQLGATKKKKVSLSGQINRGGKMSKKDYKLIAKGIREARFLVANSVEDQMIIDTVVIRVGTRLAEDNERFNMAKFVKACEVDGK